MSAAKAFFGGFNLRSLRIALYPWLFNLLFSVPLFWVSFRLLASAAEKTGAAALGERIGLFNLLVDTWHNFPGSLGLVLSLALLLLCLYILLAIFLAGGIYALLIEGEKAALSQLISASALHFPGMLTVFLINILNWAAAAVIPLLSLVLFFSPGFLSLKEGLVAPFCWLWLALTALIFTISSFVYDFCRIFKLKEGTNPFSAFVQAIRFTFSNKLNLAALALFYALFLALLYLVDALILSLSDNLPSILLLFVVYQLLILVRYYLKVVFMHSEVQASRFFERSL